jgi:hypothetical protein
MISVTAPLREGVHRGTVWTFTSVPALGVGHEAKHAGTQVTMHGPAPTDGPWPWGCSGNRLRPGCVCRRDLHDVCPQMSATLGPYWILDIVAPGGRP